MDRTILHADQTVPGPKQERQMAPALLMGSHSHATCCGINVHVYRRGDKYLARGRYQGQMFGQTLGNSEGDATVRLRQLLVEIENGSFIRPSEARKRPLSDGRIPRLTVRQLASEFLAEKRKIRGRRTTDTYRSRLGPVLDFAELPTVRKRWPLAQDINREFLVDLRAFLHQYRTTRNGRAGATPKLLSGRQIVNVLECLRTMLAWARRAEVRKLPPEWVNPLTPDLVGSPPAKDPLREDQLPQEARVGLVRLMDHWQLCHLALSVVLPLRPEEAAGLLVSDVNFEKGWLTIGTRMDGADCTKGRTSFVLPFPDELRPVLVACIGGRAAGPLLQCRKVFEGHAKRPRIASREELERLYEEKLATVPRDEVLTAQDRKGVFRRLLRELGGVTEDQLARECKGLLRALGAGDGVTLYTLRGSVTTSMERANVPHLELRYLTGHATTDILNNYVGLAPVGAMGLYFEAVRPLLEAIAQRSQALGIMES